LRNLLAEFVSDSIILVQILYLDYCLNADIPFARVVSMICLQRVVMANSFAPKTERSVRENNQRKHSPRTLRWSGWLRRPLQNKRVQVCLFQTERRAKLL